MDGWGPGEEAGCLNVAEVRCQTALQTDWGESEWREVLEMEREIEESHMKAVETTDCPADLKVDWLV